ncbi:MAG: ChbG/HpnK family deacetylase [Bacteroidia bacterium]|nr:ChbG/HpnK family deacetylase [Bacteroidia bacterium]
MNRTFHFLTALTVGAALAAPAAGGQTLIVRGDDIGGSHGSNMGVIKAYREGIERSTEIMTVAPWFPEAVSLLRENPGLDVGVHIVFTSEWDGYKWRPLTHCPSLCDGDGYFLRGTFPSKDYPGGSMMENRDRLDLGEIEAEMRAQIEMAKKYVPNLTHLTSHMAWCIVDPRIDEIARRLCTEYGLFYMDSAKSFMGQGGINVKSLGFGMGVPVGERVEKFIEALSKMEKGSYYVTIDHPAVRSAEMEATSHIGYENVAEDRQGVVDLWTSPVVLDYIREHGIELISFGEAVKRLTK